MNSIFDFFEEFYSKEQAAILIQNILDFDSSDVVIKDLLQMLGQKTKSERSYILEYEKGKIYKNTYEWCAEGIESRQEAVNAGKIPVIQWRTEAFYNGNSIIVEDFEQLKFDEPMAYALIKPRELRSIVIIPLFKNEYRKHIIGLIALDNPNCKILKNKLELLTLFSDFVSKIIKKRNIHEKITNADKLDKLTGLRNRFSYYQILKKPIAANSVGILYLNICDLKRVNADFGYDVADDSIKYCAKILLNVFHEYRIFRIGSAEFVVYCEEISQEQFSRLINQANNFFLYSELDVAFGNYWTDTIHLPLQRLIDFAEKDMELCKSQYYSGTNPATGASRDRRKSIIDSLYLSSNVKSNAELSSFLKDNFFDLGMFLKALSMTEYYPYFGDMRTNNFYITDNMKNTFGFESNVVEDFISKWMERIPHREDSNLFIRDLERLKTQKEEVHDIRYRVKDKEGKEFWIRCCGSYKWDEKKENPLFFSGAISKLEYEFIIDPITNFPREQGAILKICEIQPTTDELTFIGFRLNNFMEINQLRGRDVSNKLIKDISLALFAYFEEDLQFFRLDGLKFLTVISSQSLKNMKMKYPEESCRDGDEIKCKEKKTEDLISKIKKVIEAQYDIYSISVRKPVSLAVIREKTDNLLVHETIAHMVNLLDVAKASPEKDYVDDSTEDANEHKERSKMVLTLNRDIAYGCFKFWTEIQPVVNAKTGKIESGELLVRWKYKDKEISPSVFIPILEENKQIIPLGKWIFEHAVSQCKYILNLSPDFHLNFNVSYHQILDNDFIPFMEKTLETYGLKGNNLVVEITETNYNEDPKKLKEFIRRCNEIGMKVALDDFGTGYSSLEMMLKNMLNIVKIDRSLMKEMNHSKESNDFITSIVYSCHKFGKQVCVEGVETEEEYRIVRETGCDSIQGYFFHKPMDMQDLLKLLVKGNGSKKN
ncbi:MAG: EAL domain-containing protein [Eubacteriales bacterium]|nr:EAL domain-containing protein [Eubacteriales bacterium]